MIGLCTDSNAQLSDELRDRFDVVVVPITIELDGHEYLEGVDLDADTFYGRFHDGQRPVISTSQPSPGQFALAYEELVERGCTEILSVHIGSALSGTLNSARLAAHRSTVPVRLVDTGVASFGISCCLWAAADAIAAGAGIDEAAQVAEALAPTVGNVFTVASLELVRAGGRAAAGLAAEPGPGTPVLTLRDGRIEPLGLAADVDEAVAIMAAAVLAAGGPTKVAIGLADRAGAELSEALATRLTGAAEVVDLVRYRIGPSVGAHTGPGTAGAFFFPAS